MTTTPDTDVAARRDCTQATRAALPHGANNSAGPSGPAPRTLTADELYGAELARTAPPLSARQVHAAAALLATIT